MDWETLLQSLCFFKQINRQRTFSCQATVWFSFWCWIKIQNATETNNDDSLVFLRLIICTIDKKYYKHEHKISYKKEMQLNQKFDHTNSNTSWTTRFGLKRSEPHPNVFTQYMVINTRNLPSKTFYFSVQLSSHFSFSLPLHCISSKTKISNIWANSIFGGYTNLNHSLLALPKVSRPSVRLRTILWNTSLTWRSKGSNPAFIVWHTCPSSCTLCLTSASLSSVNGNWTESANLFMCRVHFSIWWISFNSPQAFLRSLLRDSSIIRSCSDCIGAAQLKFLGIEKWTWSPRSWHGIAATRAHITNNKTELIVKTATASPRVATISFALGAAKLFPIAWSCLAADHDRETLHDSDLKCPKDRWSRLTLFRPKDRFRWATETLESLSSSIPIAKSIKAFLARRNWPSPRLLWLSKAHGTISRSLCHWRICSIPSRIALQTSNAFTLRSKNSPINRSIGALPKLALLLNKITLNSSWQQRNTSRSFLTQDNDRSSEDPEDTCRNRSATCLWNASSSTSKPVASWVPSMEWTWSRRMLKIERPMFENGDDEPWKSVAGIITFTLSTLPLCSHQPHSQHPSTAKSKSPLSKTKITTTHKSKP